MSLYQIRFEQSAWTPSFALLRMAPRTHLVADAVFALVILPMIAMIALLFWLAALNRARRCPTRWTVQGCSSCRPNRLGDRT